MKTNLKKRLVMNASVLVNGNFYIARMAELGAIKVGLEVEYQDILDCL